MRRSSGTEVSPIDVRNTDEVERAIAAFARKPNGGLIVLGSFLQQTSIATRSSVLRHNTGCRRSTPADSLLPGGGLVSYGADQIDL